MTWQLGHRSPVRRWSSIGRNCLEDIHLLLPSSTQCANRLLYHTTATCLQYCDDFIHKYFLKIIIITIIINEFHRDARLVKLQGRCPEYWSVSAWYFMNNLCLLHAFQKFRSASDINVDDQSIDHLISGRYSIRKLHIARLQSQSKKFQQGMKSCINSCTQIQAT